MAKGYRKELSAKIADRKKEMKEDDNSHYLVYKVLGISEKQGKQIDLHQNSGRLLYRHLGGFLESAALLCLKHKFPKAQYKVKIKNTLGKKPKTFEIDCLVFETAYEVKWRDATTDGDHISKEHTRLKNIKKAGYTPVRVMFFKPQRGQAQKIQDRLEKIYKVQGGKYYSGLGAFNHIKKRTGVDLKKILQEIASAEI
jgi:hypothetical protein